MFFFYENKPYVAIIGDIKNSRQLDDRKSVQEQLKTVLKKINDEFSVAISSNFMITLGDEFQGLLCDGIYTVDIVEQIQREMYPVEIRFGIGVGQITTDINPDMAIGADGPGYYKAREAIEMLKTNEQRSKTQCADIRIEIEEDANSVGLMLNTIFSLMTVVKHNWTPRQREIIWEIEKYGDSQLDCAERLNISQSTVQRSLSSSNYYDYKNAKETVNNVLKEIGELHV